MHLFPFIHRFIKNEENKKEVLKTFEKEEISKPLLDANKQVYRYDFLQEFCIINGELKGNESVSREIIGLLYYKESFY